MARPTLALLAIAAVPYALLANQQPKPSPVEAERAAEVLAMFKASCFSCHTGDRPAGKLDLGTAEGIAKGGISGKLFEVGKGASSLLVQRLRGEGGMPQMPMGFAPLTKSQIDKVIAWIDSGARVDIAAKPHWAYRKPVRPTPPRLEGWGVNAIDAFVYARLKREGLKPSPRATKEALIRRVSLDLIGLPPTVEEVDAFLADARPDAYERLVDRLLASPHYGERQARIWLDLARYADTDGYEKDLRRTAWKWRDWVIDAFNANMPYDRFTIEQIAGDQLPNPTLEQLIATGFNRNTMLNLEGGVDQEEAHYNVVLDRVNTTSTVWLGSTLACARCHDHKYDPFSQKDYFRLAAFFSNAAILPRGPKEVSEEKWYETSIEAPTPAQSAKRAKLRAALKVAERKLGEWAPDLDEPYRAWTREALRGVSWQPLRVGAAKADSGSALKLLDDGSVLVSGENPRQDSYTLTAQPDQTIHALRLETLADPSLPSKGPGRAPNGNFVITNVKLAAMGKTAKFRKAVADFSQQGFPAQNATLGNPQTGWAVSGQTGQNHVLILELQEPIEVAPGDPITVTIEQRSNFDGHNLGRFRLSATSWGRAADSLLPGNVRAALEKDVRTDQEEALLRKHFLSITALREVERSERDRLTQELRALQAEIPTALIMRDKPNPGPLTAWLRTRGEFLSKAELVTAGTPAVLPPMPEKPRVNRLDLAKWLVSKENPLTARVQMNRMWEQYFGRGIVETSEDFGTQSSPPSHPELLDWLATEFMGRNWNMKAMHKLIVMSETYRQTSNATPELRRRDPNNVLLARGPRYRLEAELIRDTVLTASGLLNRKVGGPSVFPYQPEGVWESAFTNERWMESENGDQYRRGIYTFWKRTMPYASFMAFDATSREECTVRRVRTNTPLQALAMLNDQAVFRAAQALGRSMAAKGSVVGAIRLGFRSCTARNPSQAERERLERLFATLRQRYSKQPSEAKKLGGSADSAAWTMVASVLLNLDETITKS